MPPRSNGPAPWRPTFLHSAVECAEMAAELIDLANGIDSEGGGARERTRVARLRNWAAQLEQRNGRDGGD